MSRRLKNVPMIPTLTSWCSSESQLVSIHVASLCSFSPNVTADGRRTEDWSRDDVLAGVHAELPASHAAAQRKWNVCWHCVGTFAPFAASISNLAQKICLCRFSALPSRYFSCRPGRQNRNVGIVWLCKNRGDLKCERFIHVTSTFLTCVTKSLDYVNMSRLRDSVPTIETTKYFQRDLFWACQWRQNQIS